MLFAGSSAEIYLWFLPTGPRGVTASTFMACRLIIGSAFCAEVRNFIRAL